MSYTLHYVTCVPLSSNIAEYNITSLSNFQGTTIQLWSLLACAYEINLPTLCI